MDFAQLPPEVNSALIYSGPGSGPMLAASAAWMSLAGELRYVAAAFGSAVAALTEGPWQGPSAAAIIAASTPQVTWLGATAGQAERAAGQAMAAASAYEAAFFGSVPPPEIVSNRILLGALLATNFLGQNTAAIAATEAQYAEMWAQDAATMYTYAGTSAAAATLPPFNFAAPTVNAGGVAAQLTAVSQAIGTSAIPKDLHEIPKALSKLAGITNDPPWLNNPAVALGLSGHTWNATGDGVVVNGMLGDLAEGLTGSATLDASSPFDSYIRLISPLRLSTTASKDVEGLAESLTHFAPKAAEKAAEGATKALAAAPQALGGAVSGAAAAVGNALPVGGLSVPVSWAGSAPSGAPIVVTAGLNSAGGAAAASSPSGGFGGLPLMGSGAGRAAAAHFNAPRYGFKPTIVVHPLAGG
jgi:PPE-repeat protein